jgi:transposase
MGVLVRHLSEVELQDRLKRCGDASEARHLQVVLALMQGRGVAETARLTGFGARWIRQLRERWNRFGAARLGDRRRGNGSAPRLLTPKVLGRLEMRVATPPEGGGVWSGPKVAGFLAAEHGLSHVAPQRGWEALKAIGWSLQRPRPRHARSATDDERAEFKKTSAKRWTRRRPNTRAQRSPSLPPTSTGSA